MTEPDGTRTLLRERNSELPTEGRLTLTLDDWEEPRSTERSRLLGNGDASVWRSERGQPVVVPCERHAAVRGDARSRSEAAVGYRLVSSRARGPLTPSRWARDRHAVGPGAASATRGVRARELRYVNQEQPRFREFGASP
jgi:hypothetical protein